MLSDCLFHFYQLIFKADSQSFVIKLFTGITVIVCSHTLQSVENQSFLVLYYMRLNCNVLQQCNVSIQYSSVIFN